MKVVERDVRLIRWLNGWGAATVQQIAAWMPAKFSTAARRVAILVEEGFLKRAEISFVRASPILPSMQGCRIANDDLAPLSRIRLSTYLHDRQIIDVSRSAQGRFGGEIEPARRIRHRLGGASHVPDAILHREGEAPVAIELELSAKTPARLKSIIDGYRANLDFKEVWYITDSAEVVRALKRATGGDQTLIKIVTFTPKRVSEDGADQ
jgi:hypothetical protein